MSKFLPSARGASHPSLWLMAILAACVALILMSLMSHQAGAPQAAEVPSQAVETPVHTPEDTPVPTPEPTPSPTPEPDWSQPVPESEAVAQEDWFADAVFIGDSRTDGLHIFSDITAEAVFLEHTGITVYEILDGKKVIRQEGEKLPILDVLAQKQYGKVYVMLGVNELGYKAPQDFAEHYGKLIDAIRESQEDARIYVQSIIPVNTADCKSYDQPYYVTNEGVVAYNEALVAMAQEKKVFFLNIAEVMEDEDGELKSDLSADGVHFKKSGYLLWLDYLTTHTGVSS